MNAMLPLTFHQQAVPSPRDLSCDHCCWLAMINVKGPLRSGISALLSGRGCLG
jgi:hypothetical protein